MVWADKYLRTRGGFAIFFADDGYLIGPADAVYHVMQEFGRRIKKRLNLVYNNGKCKIWFLDPNTLQSFQVSNRDCLYNLTLEGLIINGVPLGNNQFTHDVLRSKTESVLSETTNICDLLHSRSLQNLYALMVYCCNTRVQHIAQILPPKITAPHLAKFDDKIKDIAESCTGIKSSNQPTMVKRRLQLPSRLNGGKLRSALDVAPAAYVGGLLQTLPAMIERPLNGGRMVIPGILDHMTDVFGRGAFDDSSGPTRFDAFINHCEIIPAAASFIRNWKFLRQEVYGPQVKESDIPDRCPFRASVKAAGTILGEVFAKPQHVLTQVREKKRFKELIDDAATHCKGKEFEDTPQHVMAFLSVDRFSQQFVATPATESAIMSNVDYVEAWSTYMGTVSPVCVK